ncbi:MAG TPA: TonB-dependent siderophore receptor [Chitinophagaceae bacterium]|nr:TonB-dependent siderophore receptor [Chitinophagaceae bacterium]
MKIVTVISLMLISLDALSQRERVLNLTEFNSPWLAFQGGIAGQVKTTDGQPAAYVTISIRENGKTTITDDLGSFAIRNLKDGVYTLEVTMIGLKPQQKTVEVKNGETTLITLVLLEDARQLAEVVIEASQKRLSIGKISIPDRDFPQSTGVVPNKVISDQQAIRLGEVVKNVPGVSLIQTRYGVNESYGARGYIIGVTGGAGGGSIFKNGLPANIAGMPEAATLESVEIIKGSTAFLYGSSSAGLIVNMITKKPQYHFGGTVSLNAGSYRQYKPVVDVYGPITRNLAFRVVGTYENDRSYRERVKVIRHYLNPSVMFKIGKNSTLLIQGDYLRAQITPDPGVGLLDSGRVLTRVIPRSRFQNTGWAYNRVEQGSASAEFKQVFSSKFTLRASTSYQSTDVDAYGVGNLNTASKTGVIARPLSRAHGLEVAYASQVTVEGKFPALHMQHQVVTGADFTSIITYTDAFTLYNSDGSLLKTYDTINLLDPTRYVQRTDIPPAQKTAVTRAPSNRAGVFVQDLVTITEQVKLFAGLRYSYQATVQTTIDSLATVTRPAITTRGAAPTTRYLVFSPKAGIVYQPTARISLYASYANNFTANTGVDVYGNPLPASIIHQYEIGAKNNLLNGKLSTNLSIYRIVNSNLAQQAAYLADGVTPNTNGNIKTLSGQTTSDGFEIGLNGMLSKNCYFISGYSYNYIRFTHTSGAKGSNIEGERLVNAPGHTANATAFYTYARKRLKGLKLGASVFYTGARFGGYNNTVGQSVLGSRMVALTGFTTVDLSAGYTYRKVSLQVKLSNVFNSLNYLVHDNYSITPIAPREVRATVTYTL